MLERLNSGWVVERLLRVGNTCAVLQRALEDAVLTERIRAIHAASDGNYGSPNIHVSFMSGHKGLCRAAATERTPCLA